MSVTIQWWLILRYIILGSTSTFLKCGVWFCPGCFWRLRESCCCWWHWALWRAVWLTAKVLSLQLGISLEPLQSSHLTLLYSRHKQSAELTARGNQKWGDDTWGHSKVKCRVRDTVYLRWRYKYDTKLRQYWIKSYTASVLTLGWSHSSGAKAQQNVSAICIWGKHSAFFPYTTELDNCVTQQW